MKRRITWIIGTVIILGVVGYIILSPPAVLFFPNLPYIELFKRGFLILLLSCALCLYRIIQGPTAADRVVAIDVLGILILGFCALLSIPTNRSWYIDIGIAWALQSFIATLALAKYLEGKGFEE